MGFVEQIRGGLIVSCQYSAGDAFESPECAARFAKAALDGGACGIRANGGADIAAIRAATGLPVIGIRKRKMKDGRILITPSLEDASDLVQAANQCRGSAQRAVERMAKYLAIACRSLIHVFDPELIVLSGGLAQDNELLLRTLREELKTSVFAPDHRKTRILATELGYEAGLMGAAALARDID